MQYAKCRFSQYAAHVVISVSLGFDTYTQMSRVMRKPAFYICENKDDDQLRGNYLDSTIPLLPKFEISSLKPFSGVVSDLVGNPEYRFYRDAAQVS